MTMRMTANSRWDNQLEEIRRRVDQRQFWQDVATKQVAPDSFKKNAGENGDSPGERLTNSCRDNEVRTNAPRTENSVLRNTLASKELCEFKWQKSEPTSHADGGNSISPSKLVRFSKFNFVGGIGIAVQFAALFLLKSVFNFNYLLATALAVETAVLHNFVWHERFTWVDRIRPAPEQRTSGAKARILSRLVRGAEAPLFHGCARVCSSGLKRCATPNPWRSSFARLARFHLGNGAVSILGNLALMKLLAGQGHMNYLAANAIAITLCSLVNFLVSDAWVFAQE
ncbi:GtrA family protein (modular protein) [Candidatus Sulfotelmatobacter kueseliae]|uniref:GtrA family protein (Modular protein) n=1 Tax=Candidatus Sulfotelmatobacter kueseliae TaxID=2042962 RepID=A0A2U3KMS0_9BACT|nr:GtrA family protein (modular protein) [Candidatus Sulfotelmatobacter kueseliae]